MCFEPFVYYILTVLCKNSGWPQRKAFVTRSAYAVRTGDVVKLACAERERCWRWPPSKRPFPRAGAMGVDDCASCEGVRERRRCVWGGGSRGGHRTMGTAHIFYYNTPCTVPRSVHSGRRPRGALRTTHEGGCFCARGRGQSAGRGE